MKNLKLIFTVLCCALLTINLAFAQGKGKGKGQGLLNNTGCENGKGFTTGQGHIKGKSEVECAEVECLENVITAAYYHIEGNGRGTVTDHEITGSNTIRLYVETVTGDCKVYDLTWIDNPCIEPRIIMAIISDCS